MRGLENKRDPLFLYVYSESFIPADHPLHSIRLMADKALTSISGEFERMYSCTGRPSVPPEVSLKSLLFMSKCFSTYSPLLFLLSESLSRRWTQLSRQFFRKVKLHFWAGFCFYYVPLPRERRVIHSQVLPARGPFAEHGGRDLAVGNPVESHGRNQLAL